MPTVRIYPSVRNVINNNILGAQTPTDKLQANTDVSEEAKEDSSNSPSPLISSSNHLFGDEH